MVYRTTTLEVIESLRRPELWSVLAWYDIRQRYRRSLLGPLWLTISTAVMVTAMGVLWSTIFKTDIRIYLPLFAVGYVIWTYFSTQISDSATGYVQFENIIKQIRLPFPVFILRLLVRNLIIFAHNFVIVIFVVSLVGTGWSLKALIAIPGLLLFTLTLLFISQAIAILCTRYRDLVPIIQSILQIVYFVTPIMWMATTLPDKHRWVIDFNPMSHLIDIVRLPLLGYTPSELNWSVSIGTCVASGLGAYMLLKRYRLRIAYWL